MDVRKNGAIVGRCRLYVSLENNVHLSFILDWSDKIKIEIEIVENKGKPETEKRTQSFIKLNKKKIIRIFAVPMGNQTHATC